MWPIVYRSPDAVLPVMVAYMLLHSLPHPPDLLGPYPRAGRHHPRRRHLLTRLGYRDHSEILGGAL